MGKPAVRRRRFSRPFPIPLASETEDITPMAFTWQTERLTSINTCEPAMDTMEKPYDVPPLPANKIQDKDLGEHLQMQKECLEVNGKKASDNNDDTEVGSILEEIQLPFDLVTPIPATSSASICANTKDDNNYYTCLEAREEIKVLKSSVAASLADFAKQVEILITSAADLGKEVLELKTTSAADLAKPVLNFLFQRGLFQNFCFKGIGAMTASVNATQCVGSNTDKVVAEDLECDNYAAEVAQNVTELDAASVADLAMQVLEELQTVLQPTLSQNKGIGAMTASASATQCVGSNTYKVVAEDFECDNYAAEVAQNVTELDNRPIREENKVLQSKDDNNCLICLDVKKLREENKVLQSSAAASMAVLAKEIEIKTTRVANLRKLMFEIKTTSIAKLVLQTMSSHYKGIGAMTASANGTQCVGSNTDKVVAEDFKCDNSAAEVAPNVKDLDYHQVEVLQSSIAVLAKLISESSKKFE